MKVIRDLGEDPDEIVREAAKTVSENWRYHPYRQDERVRQLLQANTEELARRRKAEELVDEGRILLEEGLLLVRKLERRRGWKFVLDFTRDVLAGVCLAYLIIEGLRWLLS